MTVTLVTDGAQTGWMKIHILGNATATANQIGQVANPEGVLLQITDAFLYVTTPTAGSSLIDIGVTATSGADDTDLISAFDTISSTVSAGTAWQVIGKNRATQLALTTPYGLKWAATSYLTVYNAAAVSSAALVADLYVQYVRLA
jgi:hypothetical protein